MLALDCRFSLPFPHCSLKGLREAPRPLSRFDSCESRHLRIVRGIYCEQNSNTFTDTYQVEYFRLICARTNKTRPACIMVLICICVLIIGGFVLWFEPILYCWFAAKIITVSSRRFPHGFGKACYFLLAQHTFLCLLGIIILCMTCKHPLCAVWCGPY